MNVEILAKLENVLTTSSLGEADVQHLFTLARKLIENVPKPDRPKYALLKFYCDWTLHSEIDRSETGAEILAKIHHIFADHLKKTDNSTFSADLSATLSLNRVRAELNDLISHFGGAINVVDEAKWCMIVPILMEIISHSPLKIASKRSKLAKWYRSIRSRPLKGTSVVEELSVVKVWSAMFNEKAPSGEITYCLMLNTTDTTKIITPLIRS